jgi:hypothetical protein
MPEKQSLERPLVPLPTAANQLAILFGSLLGSNV